MGCDIHMALEVKHKSWKCEDINVNNCWQDYDYFGALAGVRGMMANTPIPAKGLPPDSKILTQGAAAYILSDMNLYNAASIDPSHPLYNGGSILFASDLYYYLGEHSYSYLTLKEVKHVYKANRGLISLKYLVRYMKLKRDVYGCNDHTIRVVFGFDS